ncbi:HAD family hydrolase [Candidatus Stoquefichus massiliensis]|uniref:HAD family hydrolase n=1 Tax=Candidatus Stoquefichus massiliensis TaxID=1470350 RepID=UPI000485C170|nr:HAD family hydrolase [Candidatus Stoquefichus massiliensis]
MKKGCLFDLDGTLVNSLADLAISVNKVLQIHHLPTYELSEYNQFVGNGVKKLMERALGQDHIDMLDECLEEFHKVYEEQCLDQTEPYPGIYELIQLLRQSGVQLGVVTNKPHYLAVRIVEHCFPGCFQSIIGQQTIYPLKPHPESTCIALMNLKVSHQECYFIGDSQVDIDTGYNANMETIGVTWGFRGRHELETAGATYIVENADELKELILNDRCE